MKKSIAIVCAILLILPVLLTACQPESTEPTTKTVTVSFDINYDGGVNPKAQTVEQGKTVELPAVSRDEFDFDGWYTASTGGTFVGFDGYDYTANSDVTLYAHWDAKQKEDPSDPTDPDPGDTTPTESKTIVFYTAMNTKISNIVYDAIESFETKYPDWEVKCTNLFGMDLADEQILADLQVNKQPDIAFCYSDYVAKYIQTGKVVDLSKFVNSTETVNGQLVGYTASEQADFVPVFWNDGIAGHTYGNYDVYGYDYNSMFTLPFTKSTEVMYYNKTVLDRLELQPAATWDELWQQCEIITRNYPRCIPIAYDSESYWFITMCEQNGWGYTTAQGYDHFLFNNDNTAQWLTQLQGYYNMRYFTTFELYGAYSSNLFNLGAENGGCVYSIYTSSAASYYNSGNFEVGVAQIPASVGGNNHSIAQGSSLVMFSNDSYTNADEREMMTFLLMKELLDPVIQAQLLVVNNNISVRSSVYDLAGVQDYLNGTEVPQQTAKLVQTVLDDLFTTPVITNSAQARIQVGKALYYAMKGDKTAAQALSDAYNNCR